MRIVFMGTPDFAKESLESIYNTNNEIIAVVTNPDKPKGRGMKMLFSPVKEFAIEKNIPIYQPQIIKDNEDFFNEMKNLKPDLFCVVAYGKILPKKILDIPKYGSINVHGSLLPKYRGAAPIQWAVINGDKETGITTMFMDEGMDSGDIILKEKVQIEDEETTGELWEILSKLGGKLLVKTIEKIENAVKETNDIDKIKEIIGVQKQDNNFTTAPMLNKEISKIDWNKSISEIHNLVRGLNPIMGAYTFNNNKKIKIWKTRIVDNSVEGKNPGDIIVNGKELYVKTKDGLLSILEIQGENGKKMDIASFLNGNKIEGKFE